MPDRLAPNSLLAKLDTQPRVRDFLARAVVTRDVRPGVVCAPSVWWPKLCEGGRNVNAVTSPAATDMGGGPIVYDCLVEVSAQ